MILVALCLVVLLLTACARLRCSMVHKVGLGHLLLQRLVVVVLQAPSAGRIRLVTDPQPGGDDLVADRRERGGGWLGSNLDP